MPDIMLQINTGVRIGQRDTDWKLGSTSQIKHEVRNSTRDWRSFRSRDERQNMNPADRMNCVTCSATNIWEQQANWMLANNLWPADALAFWNGKNSLGVSYIVNGKFEISRRFTAKLGKTTKEGAYFYDIWDSIRNDGVVPDSAYFDSAAMGWDEYYQPIPQNLIALGHESLKFFTLLYESMSPASPAQMQWSEEMAPLQIGVTTKCGWGGEVPICLMDPNHAADNDHIRDDQSFDIFDSYDPFSKHLPRGYAIPICYRAVLYPVKRVLPIVPPSSSDELPEDIAFGEKGDKVVKLKVALAKLGWPDGQGDTYDATLADTVFRFQLANLDRTFFEMVLSLKGRRVGPRTRAVINEALRNKQASQNK